MAITMPVTNSRPVTASQRRLLPVLIASGTTAGLLMCYPAQADDWNFTPRLTVNETYTSNLNLSSTDEESSFITQVAPGFSLRRQGARARLDVDYSLNWTEYSSDEANDYSRHRLQANGNAELIEDYLYIDASAGISQQLISNTNASTGNSALNNDAFTDTRTFSISPYWKQRIGDDLNFIARLTYDDVSYDEGSSDNDGVTFSTSIDYQTDTTHRDFHWALDINNSRVASDTDSDIDSDTVRASVGYRFGPKFDTTLSYGYVDNHLASSTDESAEAGDFVGAEIEWTPTRRTRLEASYDTRKTTAGYGLDFSHRHRHLTMTASYTESLTDSRSGVLSLPPGTLICDQDATNCTPTTTSTPINSVPTDKLVIYQNIDTTLVDDRFIQKATRASLIYNKGKSAYTLGLFDSEREYQSGNLGTETSTGFNLGWRVTLNSRMTGNLSYSWSELELNSGDIDHTNSLSASLSRQLDRDTSVSLGISHYERSSDTAVREFDEQSVFASFTRRF